MRIIFLVSFLFFFFFHFYKMSGRNDGDLPYFAKQLQLSLLCTFRASMIFQQMFVFKNNNFEANKRRTLICFNSEISKSIVISFDG